MDVLGHAPMNSSKSTTHESVSVSPIVGPIVPAWLDDSEIAQMVLREAASSGVDVYVLVPPRMVVIERYELFESRRGDRYELSRSYNTSELRRRGETIDEAVIRKDIRFLELAPEAVRNFAESLAGVHHWFQGGAICSGEQGELVKSRPWATVRCVRPSELIQKTFFRPRHPLDRILPPPLVYAAEHELRFGIDSLFVDARGVKELKAVVLRNFEDDDRHNLSKDMPALLYLYRAAMKFSGPLSALTRGNAPKDKERLSEVKQRVGMFLAKYGRPFHTLEACKVSFRVIDPEHVWRRGPASTSFEAGCLSFPDIEQQFESELYVTKALRVLIMMAREIIRARGQPRHWSTTHADTMTKLQEMGFKGEPQQQILARILRETVAVNFVAPPPAMN